MSLRGARAQKEIASVKHRMWKVWSAWRIYVEGQLLANLLVSMLNCGRGRYYHIRIAWSWGATAARKGWQGFCFVRNWLTIADVSNCCSMVGLACKTRWIYHLHGLLCSLLGGFLSWQLWGQLPTWFDCSGKCKYVQDQLFYTFLSGDSPACASPRVHYKTRLHLLNGKSLHCGFLVSAKGYRIVDLFLPSTSQGKPRDNRDFPARPLLQIDSRLHCHWLLRDEFYRRSFS